MSLTASAIFVAAALSAAPASATDPRFATASALAAEVASDISVASLDDKRPAALMPLYGAFAGLQGVDVYSTRRAIGRGAVEANPIMTHPSSSTGAMLAVKAASTAATIYFVERAWKKNRKGAVILMAAINGVTAAVVAHNMRMGR